MFSLSRQSINTFFLLFLCIFGVGLIQFSRLQKLNNSNQSVPLQIQREINSENIRLRLLKKCPLLAIKT
jgi:hypothetical protein